MEYDEKVKFDKHTKNTALYIPDCKLLVSFCTFKVTIKMVLPLLFSMEIIEFLNFLNGGIICEPLTEPLVFIHTDDYLMHIHV